MLKNVKIGTRLTFLIGLSILVAIILMVQGLIGLNASQQSLKTVYEDRMVPLRDLALLNEHLQENAFDLRYVLAKLNNVSTMGNNQQDLVAEFVADTAKSKESADSIWKAYMATYLTPDEKILADQFAQSLGKYETEGLNPSLAALRSGNHEEAQKLAKVAENLYEAVDTHLEALKNLQAEIGESEYKAGVQRFETARTSSIVLLLSAIAILIWLGLVITRSITVPMFFAIDVFGKISEGNYTTHIDVIGKDETSQVLDGLKSMQTKLNNDVAEIRSIVEDAVNGDFSTKMSLDGRQGSNLQIAQLLNKLSDTTEIGLKDICRVATALAQGDLTQSIDQEYPGLFGEAKDGINVTVEALKRFIAEIGRMSREHDAGDIEVFIDSTKFQGDYSNMAKGVNEMVAEHISVKKKAIGVFKAFGEGNFDAPM